MNKMQKWTYLIAAAIVASTATPIQALDLSALTGTTEVQFQPMQSAGIKEGCTLVYRLVGQNYATRKGNLISLAGNIAYMRNKQRNNVVLSLKIGMIDSLDPNAYPVDSGESIGGTLPLWGGRLIQRPCESFAINCPHERRA